MFGHFRLLGKFSSKLSGLLVASPVARTAVSYGPGVAFWGVSIVSAAHVNRKNPVKYQSIVTDAYNSGKITSEECVAIKEYLVHAEEISKANYNYKNNTLKQAYRILCAYNVFLDYMIYEEIFYLKYFYRDIRRICVKLESLQSKKEIKSPENVPNVLDVDYKGEDSEVNEADTCVGY